MLQKGFFRVKPFNPKIVTPTVIYEKYIYGNFSFDVPANYNYIIVEIGGGAGGDWNHAQFNASGGYGGKKNTGEILLNNISRNITGTVGEQGGNGFNVPNPAGAAGRGYSNGTAGSTNGQSGGPQVTGGGGGGSTGVNVGGIVYEASGGGGTSGYSPGGPYRMLGGTGGGPNGGTPGPIYTNKENTTNGNNATDAETNENKYGYVKIFGGYNPYYN